MEITSIITGLYVLKVYLKAIEESSFRPQDGDKQKNHLN